MTTGSQEEEGRPDSKTLRFRFSTVREERLNDGEGSVTLVLRVSSVLPPPLLPSLFVVLIFGVRKYESLSGRWGDVRELLNTVLGTTKKND